MPPKEKSTKKGDGIPRFNMPPIQMQSVLVPEISISQCQVIASIPPITRRIRFDEPSARHARLPFRDGDVGRDVLPGRRPSRSKSESKSIETAASRIERDRDERTEKNLDRRLHAEHRVFFQNLKAEREMRFETESEAAAAIQRCARGLAVRMRLDPEKYRRMKIGMERRFTKEELFALAEEAIRRSGVVLD